MNRLEKLEAVALAAKKALPYSYPGYGYDSDRVFEVWGNHLENLSNALEALDACPQAEPVEGRPQRPKRPENCIFSMDADTLAGYAVKLEAYATTLEQRLEGK